MKNANDSGRNRPRLFGSVFTWSDRALDLWKAGSRLLSPRDGWAEFFEKQAKNAYASAREFSGDYELEQYWQLQGADFNALAVWFRQNKNQLPGLPERVSL